MTCRTKKSILHLTCLISLCLSPISSSGGELGDLLRATLDNPSVTSAQFQSDAASAQVDAAKGRRYGQAALNYGRHHYDGQRLVGYYAPGTLPLPLLSTTIDQAGVAYILPIDVFGQISAAVDKANGEAVAANLVYRRQTLAKLHQAASAYYTLYVLEKRRDALAVYRRFVEKLAGRMKKEFELGRAAQVDSTYAESQLAKLQSDEAALAGDIGTAQASLAEATGQTGFLPKQPNVAIPGWQETTADTSLNAKIARAREDSARAAAHEVRANLLPQVALDAGYNYNAATGGGNRNNWAYGATITVPLGVSAYRQADVARTNVDAAEENTRASVREAASTLAALHAQYAAALAEIDALGKELAYRKQVSDVEQVMHQLGNQILENVFRHEDNLLEAQTRLAQAQARAVAAWSGMQMLAGIEPEGYIAALDGQTNKKEAHYENQ